MNRKYQSQNQWSIVTQTILHTDILKGYSNHLAELHVPVNVATQLYITDCQSKYFLIE